MIGRFALGWRNGRLILAVTVGIGLASVSLNLLADEDRSALIQQHDSLRGKSRELVQYRRFDEALAAAQEAARLAKRLYGEPSSHMAEDLRWVVRLHLDRREYRDAETVMLQVIDQRKQVDAERPWLIADDVSYLRYVRKVSQLTAAENQDLSQAAQQAAAAERLERSGQLKEAAAEIEQALKLRRQTLGYDDRMCAEQLVMQANRYARLGDWKQAESSARAGLAAFSALTGETHRDYAASCLTLARVLLAQERPTDAAPWFERSAVTFQKVLGPDHESTRRSFEFLTRLHRETALKAMENAEFAQARQAFLAEKSAHDLRQGPVRWPAREAQLFATQAQKLADLTPAQADEMTTALDAVASAQASAERFGWPAAVKELDKPVATLTRLLGDSAPFVLPVLQLRAEALQEAGKSEAAETAFAQLTGTLRTALGPNAPAFQKALEGWIDVLEERAQTAQSQEDFPTAIAALKKAEPLWAERYGPEGWQVVDGRQQLLHLEKLSTLTREERRAVQATFAAMRQVSALSQQGRFAAAEQQLRTVLQTRRQLLGAKNRHVAMTLHSLGYQQEQLGQVAAAEQTYREALALRQEVLGPNHPDTAETWNNLGSLHLDALHEAESRQALAQAAAIWKKAYGPAHPQYARGLIAQSNVAIRNRDAVVAEPLLSEAIEILRPHDNDDARDQLARALNNLGGVYDGLGQPQLSAPLYREAASIWRTLGRLDDYARLLDNQAALLRDAGNWSGAAALHREALANFVLALGEGHRSTTQCRTNLVTSLIAQRQFEEAFELAQQSVNAAEQQFLLTSAAGSERQQFEAFGLLKSHLDAALSAGIPQGAAAAQLYGLVLRWKGQVLLQQRRRQAVRSDPAFAVLSAQVQAAAGKLSALSLQPSSNDRKGWEAALRAAAAERDAQERALALAIAAHTGAPLFQQADPAPLPAVPAGAALLDFLEHLRFDPATKRFRRVLLAFVVRENQRVQLVDLGSAGDLQLLVDQWRAKYAVSEPDPAASDPTAKLVAALWKPLEPHLAEAATLYVAPDGALSRFSLAALPGQKPGTFLLEERAVLVLPSARSLPAAVAHAETKLTPQGALLVGNVAFGDPPKSGFRFDPLPGTLREIDDIAALGKVSPPPVKLAEAAATETKLRDLAPAARVLHLATHGFFAPPELQLLAAQADEQARNQVAAFADRNWADWRSTSLLGAGVLTGVALAGANHPAPTDDNRWTAAEVAQLNLGQTRLVVLSACDTGVGEIASGDSVLSLQRAFHVAGSEAVVASLWRVNDDATAALMKLFYYHLWVEQKSPAAALREAQLELLRHPQRIGELARTRAPQFDAEVAVVRKPPAGQTTSPQSGPASPRLWAGFTISIGGEAAP